MNQAGITWLSRAWHRMAGRSFRRVTVGIPCLAAAFVLGHAPLISINASSAAELVMFETAFCEWCEAWDRAVGVVYHKTEEGRAAPLRRVELHAPRPEGLESIEGIVYTPTFVLVEDGSEIGRINGYPGDDHFWGLLGEMVRKLKAAPGS